LRLFKILRLAERPEPFTDSDDRINGSKDVESETAREGLWAVA